MNHQTLKLKNNMMSPVEIAKEFTQLSMRESRKSTSSRSSSCSSYSSQKQNKATPKINYPGSYPEDAIIDDEDNESTLSSPRLFATSVENNTSGKLLPSLSTISLLSLNKDQLNEAASGVLLSPQTATTSNGYSPELKKTKSSSRTTSFSHTRVSSFHHQRHSSFYQQQRRLSTQPQSIQQVPDTPNFGPTSLSGSPSAFYLGNTLPASLQRTHGFPPNLVRNNSYTGQMIITSPRLKPTQTSEVPMTPLMLSAPPLKEEDGDYIV